MCIEITKKSLYQFVANFLSVDQDLNDCSYKSTNTLMSMNATEQTPSTLIDSVERTHQNELNEHAIKSVIRKVDLRLIPLLTLLYFFSFLDRINIGIS